MIERARRTKGDSVKQTQEPLNEEDALKKKDAKPARKTKPSFNGLSPRDWTVLSRNVWSDLSSPRQARHLKHGAVFPLKLAERLVQIYSGEGDLVFDPFVGIGTTLIAAGRLGRHSLGIELNPNFANMAQEWLSEEQHMFTDSGLNQTLHTDDCRNLEQYLAESSVQVTITSPPYANFIQRSLADRKKTHKKSRLVLENNSQVKQYSENENDFGNLDYEKFLLESKALFAKLLRVTKPNGYAVWIVKDYRLPPSRPYISMHSDLAAMAQSVGWLWHDLIIWDQNEQRSLVLLGFPSRFYTNQNCSFLVVLRKNG
jgi:DNA modification methylase